ncbi:ubiquitin-like autophagy protein Apg12-domain-containing protein [Cunninghamella echinulata]|nr:ubiquitin-like autophagy protein Apg12-domain-containing protein [Cunninghamella echinulata]
MSETASTLPQANEDTATTTSSADTSINNENIEQDERSLDDIVTSLKAKDVSKVIVRFCAIGNAPILKQSYYKITASNKFHTVIQFLRKELKYQGSDPLFLYINSAFSPAPDEIVSNLYKCFGTGGHLIINYCTTAAWG